MRKVRIGYFVELWTDRDPYAVANELRLTILNSIEHFYRGVEVELDRVYEVAKLTEKVIEE